VANAAGWINTGGVTLVGPATTAVDGTITLNAHGLVNGQIVEFRTATGGAVPVLIVDAEYYVRNAAVNSFQVSATPGGAIMTFASTGGADVYTAVPEYAAVDVRRLDAIVLHPDSLDPAGSREGVRPHSTDPVTLTGTTYNVTGGLAVVYPRETSTSAAYRVYYDAETGTLNPADGSNDRLDGIDLQIQDDDEDGQGQRRARIVYAPGTPAGSPVEPDLTENSLRIATILVESGGSPGPSIYRLAPYALGAGVLPVRDATDYPDNPYAGMTVFRQDTGAFEVWFGSAWTRLASAGGYQYLDTIAYDANGTFVKADYPALRAVKFRCQGGGGAGGGAAITGAGSSHGGGGGQGGNYAEKWVLASALASSETITRGAGGTGVSGAAGNNGGTSSAGAHCIAGGGAGGNVISSGSSTWTTPISNTPITTATGSEIRYGDAGGFGLLNGTADFAMSGAGGGSRWGIGGRPVQSATGADGFAGSGYGGGGGGAANSNSQGSARTGGAGSAGRVLIDLYV
jgi:hypothetical protein